MKNNEKIAIENAVISRRNNIEILFAIEFE